MGVTVRSHVGASSMDRFAAAFAALRGLAAPAVADPQPAAAGAVADQQPAAAAAAADPQPDAAFAAPARRFAQRSWALLAYARQAKKLKASQAKVSTLAPVVDVWS